MRRLPAAATGRGGEPHEAGFDLRCTHDAETLQTGPFRSQWYAEILANVTKPS
jgi:hypothetical protein